VHVLLSDRVQLHVDAFGDGPFLLWLPGGPGLSNYLHPVAQAMAGFRHVLPDPRGTGRSEGGPHDLEVALTDLEDLRNMLGIDQWSLVGHSSGLPSNWPTSCHPDAMSSYLMRLTRLGLLTRGPLFKR
jgi:proline iminopeptidase